MARHVIGEVEPLELEFSDGTKKIAVLNNSAMLIYINEFGELDQKTIKNAMSQPYDIGSRFLYCGLKVMSPDVTLEEAMSILIKGGPELLNDILRLLIDNFHINSNDDTKKKFNLEFQKILQEMQRTV